MPENLEEQLADIDNLLVELNRMLDKNETGQAFDSIEDGLREQRDRLLSLRKILTERLDKVSFNDAPDL